MAKRQSDPTPEEPVVTTDESSVYEPMFVSMPDTPAKILSPPPAPPPALPPAAPAIPLRVFLTVSGVKPDQLAGFCNYAARAKLAPRSVQEWRTAYQTFMNRPAS